MRLRFTLTLATVALATAAFAQDTNVIGPPDDFLVRYASNLNIGDSLINITNTGSDDPVATGVAARNICANVYTFDASEEMVSCCSCLVTPNALVSLSVQGDLIVNTLSPSTPSNVVIKLVASDGGSGTCNAATPTTDTLVPGLRAWGTSLHALPGSPTPYGLTETAFLPGGLSSSELTHLTSFCGFIGSNGSGFGVCNSCRAGGLGGARK